MKIPTLGLPLALALPLSFAPAAAAGELIPELVPADAAWVMHVDLEALQRTVLWSTALEQGDLRAQLDQGVAEAKAELGFDPLTLIKSATVYADARAPQDEGVAVLVVSEDVERLLERVAAEPGYSAEDVGGRLVHVLRRPGEETMFAHVRRFEGVANRLVFLSDSNERVMRAVDVLEGARPDVTERPGQALAANPTPGTILYLETGEELPGFEGLEQVSALSALAKGLRFELGEAAGQLAAELVVTTNNAEDANNVYAVLQGVTAALNLALPQDVPAEVRQLVRSLQFSSNGNQVAAAFRYDSRQLVALMRDLSAGGGG